MQLQMPNAHGASCITNTSGTGLCIVVSVIAACLLRPADPTVAVGAAFSLRVWWRPRRWRQRCGCCRRRSRSRVLQVHRLCCLQTAELGNRDAALAIVQLQHLPY